MWDAIEARIIENERERPLALRQELFDVIRESGLKAGSGITKKMVSLEFGAGERLLWEIEIPTNFYLHDKWRDRVEAGGFDWEPREYRNGLKDGGRHTALSRSWSFGEADCIVVRIKSPEELSALMAVFLGSEHELVLDPKAITRWIERLRHFFPDLDRFDRPDPKFDAEERHYKLEIAAALKAAVEQKRSDLDLASAVISALEESNMLQWRAYWPMSTKGDANREMLWPALSRFVTAALGPADGHASALESFVDTWLNAVPNGKPDPARQIGEFLLLHLAPNEGIYIRHSVRQDFWLEAVGSRFPTHQSIADTYCVEWRFMDAVRRAFSDRGLAPRDMIDVQSALWVVHNYKNSDGASFTREDIEDAMDAYDDHLRSGAHSEIFGSFGEPRDFWVRSTRNRSNPNYPTKPIVGFLRKNTKVNGGWAERSDAAARLHNAGYVIVDAQGVPVPLPERYEHLVSGAERIRLCACNYYIEPARENGEVEVSIRAGDIANDIGLRDRFPAICSALGGREFQRAAQVPPPTSTLPNPSSSTVFTYQLAPAGEQKAMTTDPVTKAATATTNLILYGPPGTGKTFATAWEAVRLCLGEASAERFRNDRQALMVEYQRLVDERRIEFVTFHQSFSYEDFVEGLRPTTGVEREGEADGTGASAGFSLKPHAGVFKTISERARLDTGDEPAKRLDRSRSVYKIALGQRGNQEDRVRAGLEGNVIHIGWGGDIDWADERFDDFEEVRKAWNELKDPHATGKDPNIEMLYAFRSGLQVDDYVVISDGRDSFRALGRVSGEYYFDAEADFHPHRRAVEWIWRDDNGAARAPFYPRNFRRQSAYRLDPEEINWDALESVVIDPNAERPVDSARPHVLIIDEINRANISRVFGELITLLEVDKRLGCENEIKVRLPYSGMSFGVPSNLHIIGTMNTADRSIALLDTALRRRFTFRELMPDAEALRLALEARNLDAKNLDGIDLLKLLQTINERIEYLFDREHQIGHAYFTGCTTRADVDDVMRHKVIPLLAEYFYEDWSKVAAVLGDVAGGRNSHFLDSKRLTAPNGFDSEEVDADKVRWSVKANFDYSEFSA